MVYNLNGNAFNGAKISWLLERIEDSNGNTITYKYAQSTSSQQKYISEIVYGTAGHPLKVLFERESRNDEISSFIRGVDFSSDERLKKIRAFSGSSEVYSYSLLYSTVETYIPLSFIESIVYQDVATGQTLSSNFDFQTHVQEVYKTPVDGVETYISGEVNAARLDVSRIKYGDFNGDGLPDIYQVNGWGGYGQDKVYLSNGDGTFAAPVNGLNTYVSNTLDGAELDILRIQFSDFNGDGLVDIYQINGWHGYGQDKVYLSNGDGTFATPVNGVNTYVTSKDSISRIRFGDFNGDGLSDIYVIPTIGTQDSIYLSNGDGTFAAPKNGVNQAFYGISGAAYISYIEFGDFNGDGMLDVHHITGSDAYDEEGANDTIILNDKVYLSTGDGNLATPVSGLSAYIFGRYKTKLFSKSRIKYGDFNGDGLPDIYHINYGYGQDKVYLSNGDGTFAAPVDGLNVMATLDGYGSALYGNPNFSRINFGDFNGDGMTDIYHFDGWGGWAHDRVYLSNGDGTFSAGGTGPLTHVGSEPGDASLDFSRIKFGDFNGDGMLDVYQVNGWNGYGQDKVHLSNGDGTFAAPVDGLNTYIGGTIDQASFDISRINLGDFNGDGMLDVYQVNGWGDQQQDKVNLNQAKPPLLTKVTDNFGVFTEITYKPLTDKSVYTKGVNDATPQTVTIQSPMRVVSSVTKDIGIEGSNGTSIQYTSEYTYAEARYHTHGRGFLGFRVFESYDVQTQLSKTEILHHDFPYTGMVISSSTYGPNGQLLSRAENTLNAKALNGGLTLFPYNESSEEWKAEYDPSTNFSGTSEAALVADLKSRAYGSTLTTNNFDANGNNIRIHINYGDGYEQITENEYAYDNVASWYLGRLSKATVTSKAPDTTSQNETIVRSSTFTYDSNGLLLTETVEPGHPLAVTTTYTRDPQGRIIAKQINPADGPAFISETHSTLDPTGRFYTRTVNALGHTETRVYDSTRGWLLSQTGPNGRTTHFTYDALGRVIREDLPDGTWTATEYAYDDSQTVTNPGNDIRTISKYRVTTTASVSSPTTTWYDRMGREIRACTEGFDGRTIYKDTGYNALGQVDCVAENYYANSSPTHWTETTFDALGRTDVVTAPDGTKAKTIYNGRETTTIRNYQGNDAGNANDQRTITLLNAKGDRETVTSFNQADQPLVLRYHYDGVGNLLETVDAKGRIISMSYDILGNKIRMNDPDMGVWSYTYNALGQLISQTDAVGNVSTKTYDVLGRVVEESYDAADSSIATVTNNYYYDGTGEYRQLGKLHLEKSSNGFRRSHFYDDLGRSFLTVSKIEGRWFYQQTDYDGYSRPERLTHYWRPPEFDDGLHDHYLAWYSYSQETIYDNRSFVTEVRDANGETWWSSPTYNQHGQLTSYLAGNGLRTTNQFDAADQTLERIYVTPTAGGSNLLDHHYEFDSIGNLTQRRDAVKDLTENMYYDRLNRLTSATVSGGSSVNITYDDLGNIMTRTSTSDLGNVGAYGYMSGTNRVSNAGGRAFTYNANGAIIGVSGSKIGSITWSAFSKPYILESTGKRSKFGYDVVNSRITQTRQEWDPDANAGQGEWLDRTRKTYVGALFEQEQAWDPAPGSEKWDITSTRIYISTPSGIIGSWIDNTADFNPKKTFFHRDHLGSVIAESGGDISDTSTYAKITKQFSYDAWGLTRDPNTWGGAPTNAPGRTATDRGYTGHEMLDELGLIHMNGRIYDPMLGRFLSADPYIQSPSNLQNYNRYSYVLNNPVSFTDPSGFFFKKLFKSIAKFIKENWTTIVAIALYFVPFVGPMLSAAWSAAVVYHNGGIEGLLTQMAINVVTAGIGGKFGPKTNLITGNTTRELARATAHGVARGGFAELSGGDFGDGFMAGATGSIAGSLTTGTETFGDAGSGWDNGRIVARTVASAVSGGLISELIGGKFANGASTAAMVHLYNAENAEKSPGSYAERAKEYRKMAKQLAEKGVDTVWFDVAADLNEHMDEYSRALPESIDKLGQELLKKNRMTFDELMKGTSELSKVSGIKLDSLLVQREQIYVQNFFIENPLGSFEYEWIKFSFVGNGFLQPSIISRGVEYVNKRHGTFNFFDTLHRIELGESMMSQRRHGVN